jgi:hypothetical protein
MHSRLKLFALAAVITTAASLMAGGFALEIGRPSANPEAQAKHAVLVVREYACTHPERTSITATAEGIVNGKRETIPLKLVPLSTANTYAVTRQWPGEGRWVVTLVAVNSGFQWQPSAIVGVNGDSADFASVKRSNRAPTTEQVQTALNTPALAAKLR